MFDKLLNTILIYDGYWPNMKIFLTVKREEFFQSRFKSRLFGLHAFFAFFRK